MRGTFGGRVGREGLEGRGRIRQRDGGTLGAEDRDGAVHAGQAGDRSIFGKLLKEKIKGCPGRTITAFRTPFRVSLNQGMPLQGFRQLCLVSGAHSDERQPVIFPTHSHQA